MSSQIEYNQMPREPAPAVLSERKISSLQPGPNQPMTMDQPANLRGGDGGVSDYYPPKPPTTLSLFLPRAYAVATSLRPGKLVCEVQGGDLITRETLYDPS
ncbi:hypothetical protein CORC01_09088 [Colletotrichum orchidophilum]|uniref:Uncharacterized protein n=1 Tax=Colletotrichum orchidophilum TaxID=1209926 RepID=A0A1G4B2S2_9PEZI|nr:uncharacterized protein CORC01_09088 [Colletotrichum orchidophilum]OHE95656.1 hypothetical protein CORC01_09088 [Colletotrichum orchidophilum]